MADVIEYPLEKKYKYVIRDHKMGMEMIRLILTSMMDPRIVEDIYEEIYYEGGIGFVKTWKGKFGLGDDPGSAARLCHFVGNTWNFDGAQLIEATEERGHVIVTTKDPAWEAIRTLGAEGVFNTDNITRNWVKGFMETFNPKLKYDVKINYEEWGSKIEIIITK